MLANSCIIVSQIMTMFLVDLLDDIVLCIFIHKVIMFYFGKFLFDIEPQSSVISWMTQQEIN